MRGFSSVARLFGLLASLGDLGTPPPLLSAPPPPPPKILATPLHVVYFLYLSEASVQCPGEVGGPVISGNSRVSGTHAHLILNATFPCEGKVSAWICQVTDRAAAIFVDVWRRVAADPDNYFTLVGKNRIPPGYMGRHVFRIKNRYQISVQRGDFIGYHYSMQSVSKEGALAMSHGNDNVTASGNDHQTITAGLYDENFLVHTPINFNTNDKKLRYQRHALEAMVEYGQDSGTPEREQSMLRLIMTFK